MREPPAYYRTNGTTHIIFEADKHKDSANVYYMVHQQQSLDRGEEKREINATAKWKTVKI
jgi:hypothetical protein